MKKLIFALIIASIAVFVTRPVAADVFKKLYWTYGDNNKIQRANVDGSEIEDLVTFTFPFYPWHIALDSSSGKMYWTDSFIRRANLDGSNIEDVITSPPSHSIALDITDSKIYWTDNYNIYRANLDGTNIEYLITGLDEAMRDIALDVPGGKMYWSDESTDKIYRANLDGSSIEELPITLVWDEISSIELDVNAGKIYWFCSYKIELEYYYHYYVNRANLDGSNGETLVDEPWCTSWVPGGGIALDLSAGKMYWANSDYFSGKIQRANLDGSNVEDVVTGLSGPIDVAVIEIEVLGLIVTPSGWFTSQGDEGGPFTPISITMKNGGPNSIDWTASVTQDWLDVSPASGTLGPNDVNTVQISINSNANELPYGDYNDTLTITDLTNGQTHVRDINLVVLSSNKIYWTDTQTDKIQRADLIGHNVEDLITFEWGYSADIDIDYYNLKMYWTDRVTNNIQRANLDGTDVEEIIAGPYRPCGVAIDALRGKMYWTNYETSFYKKILRANLDGTNIETLIKTSYVPGGIDLDIYRGEIYWSGVNEICRAKMGGINDYITTGITNFPSGAAPRSVSVWIKWGGQTLCKQVIFGYGDDATGFLVFGAFLDESNPANLYCWNNFLDGTTYNYDTGIDITIGQWTHIVLTYDGTNIRAYKEAVLADTTARALNTVLEKSAIGANGWTRSDCFSGSIDNMMIFNKQLSQEEINLLYNSGLGTENIPDGNGGGIDLLSYCVGHLKMNDNADNTMVLDSSVNENNGTAKQNTSAIHTESGDPPYLNGALKFTIRNVETLVTGLTNPEAIDLDLVSGKMYWTDYSARKIQRANLNGSNVEDLVTGIEFPHDITLNKTEGKIYWTEAKDYYPGWIRRANLDGSNVESIVTNLGNPYGIAIAEDIYADGLWIKPLNGLKSQGYEGGPFTPASMSYTLRNTGPNSINWTASVTQSWLDVSPSSGLLGPNDINYLQININPNASGLNYGSYSDTLTINNLTSGFVKHRLAELKVFMHEFKLTASDGTSGDYFGRTVDIDGDHCVVGAPYDDYKGPLTGSAYIFEWDGTGWIQQAKLTEPDANSKHYFGTDVSIDGDRCAVGSFHETGMAIGSGWAYIFEWDGSAWTQTAKLKSSDTTDNDHFGEAVSIKGNRCGVGACYSDTMGAVYIFEWDGSAWIEQAKLTASDAASPDCFGSSVDISDDRCIIGAPYSDSNGAAYIFEWNGANWIQQAKLMASDGAGGDHFGQDVDIDGNRCVVGAEVSSGSAYIFEWNGSNWIQQAKLTASDGATSDNFGCSASINDDLCIIGAYGHYVDGIRTGTAYVFEWDGASWKESRLMASDAAYGDGFGFSVGISDDRYIIGAPFDDDKGSLSGSAYVYQPYRLADLDRNWFIDLYDFAFLASQWLQAPGMPSADIAPPGGDGFVDYYDLAVFADNWLRQ